VFCWTARCPCSDTSARLPVYASITFEGCVRSGIMSNSHGATCESLIITRIDCCNSILAYRSPPLQRVQNAAAPLVLNLDRRMHISPALQQLHTLPVKRRVTFKIASLKHQILQKRCSSYLANLVTLNTTDAQRRHLRSSTTRSAAVRRTRTQFGSVHFLFAVLLCGIVSLLQFAASRCTLQSHLFGCAFSL